MPGDNNNNMKMMNKWAAGCRAAYRFKMFCSTDCIDTHEVRRSCAFGERALLSSRCIFALDRLKDGTWTDENLPEAVHWVGSGGPDCKGGLWLSRVEDRCLREWRVSFSLARI